MMSEKMNLLRYEASSIKKITDHYNRMHSEDLEMCSDCVKNHIEFINKYKIVYGDYGARTLYDEFGYYNLKTGRYKKWGKVRPPFSCTLKPHFFDHKEKYKDKSGNYIYVCHPYEYPIDKCYDDVRIMCDFLGYKIDEVPDWYYPLENNAGTRTFVVTLKGN